MVTQTNTALAPDDGFEAGVALLAWGFLRVEIGPDWDKEQAALALRSKPWRALLTMGYALPEPDSLYSLSALWRSAGSPQEHEPRELYPPGDITYPSTGDHVVGTVEHRPDGVFADWDTAAWYAHQLDPGTIEPWHVMDFLD